MKKEIKNLNKRLEKAFKEIEALNHELDEHAKKDKQTFNNWKLDHDMTELMGGLTHERALMQDAVRELGLHMGSVDTFLEAVRQRVAKADEVINQTENTIANDPKRKCKSYVQ